MDEPKYQTTPEFILREIGDEAVLVPVGTVGELENSIINFNETYSFIWKQFEEPRTIAEVIANAKREYEAPEGVIEEQVRGAALELIKRGVIKEF